MKRTFKISTHVLVSMSLAAMPVSAWANPFGGVDPNFVPEGPQQEQLQPVIPVTPTPTPNPDGNSNIFSDGKPMSDSAYGAAKDGQGSNSSAGNIATAIGAGMVAAGTAMMPSCCGTPPTCCPAAITMIAMGVLGLMQGAANKSTSGQHGIVSKDVGMTGDSNGDGVPDYQNPDPTGSAAFKSEMSKGFNALSKVGAKLDPKTGKITFPNGATVGPGQLGDPNAMSQAGVNPTQMKNIQKQLSDLEKAALAKAGAAATAENGFESGGGGGSTTTVASDDSGAGMGGMGNGKDRDPAAASVAGMTKNFNGELIGVAGDDIFQMMARRYQQKSKEDSFLPPESSPAPFGARN